MHKWLRKSNLKCNVTVTFQYCQVCYFGQFKSKSHSRNIQGRYNNEQELSFGTKKGTRAEKEISCESLLPDRSSVQPDEAFRFYGVQ